MHCLLRSKFNLILIIIFMNLMFSFLVSGACSDGLHSFKAYAVDPAGNINSTETRTVFVDIQPPTMNITFPTNNLVVGLDNFNLNYTYKDCSVWMKINHPGFNNSWTCWYSINGGSNTTIPCNLTDGDDDDNVTIYNLSQSSISGLSEGNNIVYLYGQDGAGNIGSYSINLELDTTPPLGSHDSPADNIHASIDQNYSGTFSDDNGVSNITLNIFDESGSNVYSTTIDTSGNSPVTVGDIHHLSDGVYKWGFEAVDTLNNKLITSNRTIVIDTINPDIIWSNPSETIGSSNPTSNPSFNLNANATDSFLDAVNLTVTNSTGSIIYENFTDGITTSLFQFTDNFTIHEGNNTIEICGRDSLSESPSISDTADFRKVNDGTTTFKIDNQKTVTRTFKILDKDSREVPYSTYSLKTTESWIDDGKHYKTTWDLNKLPADYKIEVRLSNPNGAMELLTDRGVTRIVDDERTFYWRFDDIPSKDFKLEYKQDRKEVYILITRVGLSASKWSLDPIVGGLNNYCENRTVLLDTITPTISIIKPVEGTDFPNFITSVVINSNFTTSDTNLDSCWYEVQGPHYIANTTLSCTSGSYTSFSFPLIASGSYTLNLYSNDSANNLGKDSVGFTVTRYSGPRTGGGGTDGSGAGGLDNYYNRTILCQQISTFIKFYTLNGRLQYPEHAYEELKNQLAILMGFGIEDVVLKAFIDNFRGNCPDYLEQAGLPPDGKVDGTTDEEKRSKTGLIILIIFLVLIVGAITYYIFQTQQVKAKIFSKILGKKVEGGGIHHPTVSEKILEIVKKIDKRL